MQGFLDRWKPAAHNYFQRVFHLGNKKQDAFPGSKSAQESLSQFFLKLLFTFSGCFIVAAESGERESKEHRGN